VDRITVLRDGRLVETFANAGIDEADLVERMIGRQVSEVLPAMPEVAETRPVLEVRHLNAGPLCDVSLSVAPGEVVGIAGLLGAGRSELLRAVFGDMPIESGSVVLDGTTLRNRSTSAAMAAGIAMVPEDRSGEAAFPDQSVRDNLAAATVGDYWSWKRPWIASRRLRRDAERLADEFAVKARSEAALLSTLSGGNQQKVVLARWLRREPRVLLLDEPTQGVDVGARADIYGLVRAAVEKGTAVLLVASDFEELARVADRVVVLVAGRIVSEVRPPQVSADRLLYLATRGEPEEIDVQP
jgi:ABC-type sugar transport system ATPase subunit